MTDIQQAKQSVASAVTDTKATVTKLVDVTKEAGQEAVKLRQETLQAINREQTWIEKHPRTVTLIFTALIALVIAMVAKGCAG